MSFTLSDFMKTRINEASQPSPLICFYEIELPDTTYLRYVDFFDQEAPTPGKITFDGHDWDPVDVYRGDLEENLEAKATQLVLSVYDPLRTVAYFLRTHSGLVGQPVTLWITTYDHLSTPADALTLTLRIIASWTSQEPAIASIALGHFNLFESRFPRLFYDRMKCFSGYQNRFTPGNWCTYPSNEFGAQDAYDYRLAATNEEHEAPHGWWTQQALRAMLFKAHLSTAGTLAINTMNQYAAWQDNRRHGPYLYRYLSGDWDVHTKITLLPYRDDWSYGFIAQDATAAASPPELGEPPPPVPTSDWLFCGLHDNGASGTEFFVKKTEADVTALTTYSSVSDVRIRLKRSGNTFTLYTRAADDDPWTQRHETTLALPTECRIGLAIASSTESSEIFGARFDYIRFTAGGLSTCRRDFADCQVHKNIHQFNGFREIPNDRGRY